MENSTNKNIIAPVSVIIPCYRCGKTIKRAVDSVAEQTLRPAEVILVEDGSGDDTLDVLKKLEYEYGSQWIKVIELKQNYGVSYARNTGWDMANFEYIAFLDADDAWHPDKIKIQYQWMVDNQDSSVCGHAYLVLNPDNKIENFPVITNFNVHRVSKKAILFSNPFVTPSIMIKKIIDFRFASNQRYAEDHYLWMQLCLDDHKIYMLDIPLAYIFKHFGTGGLTSHLGKMRWAIIKNYYLLLKNNKINIITFFALTLYSTTKFFILLIMSPKIYATFQKNMVEKYFFKIFKN